MTHDEGRRDIRLEMPPEPEPSRFSDWSSLGSPPTRTSPHSAPGVPTEQSDNAQNHLNVMTIGEIRTEGVTISPGTEQSREDQAIPVTVRSAPLNIEVGMPRNNIESNEENVNNVPHSQTRTVRPSLQTDDVLLSRDVP